MSEEGFGATFGAEGQGRAATFDEVLRNLQLVFKRSLGGILIFWALLLVIRLLLQVPGALVGLLSAAVVDFGLPGVGAVLPLLNIPIAILVFILSILLAPLAVGVYRAVRVSLVDGPEAVGGMGNVFRLSRARYGWTLLMVLAVTGIVLVGTLLCCLPGLAAAFLLFPATYLMASTDDDFVTCFTRSFELVVNNIVLMLATFGVVIVLVVVMVCGFGVIGAVLGIVFGIVGSALELYTVQALGTSCVSPVLSSLVSLAIGFPMFVFYGAVLTSMDLADRGIDVVE